MGTSLISSTTRETPFVFFIVSDDSSFRIGMVSVAPSSASLSNLTEVASQIPNRSRWRSHGARLLRLWQRMQVSYYGGKYSIHRVLALDEYTKNTSISRVALVVVTNPLPMVALMYGQELIPLQDLRDGWSANFGMWVRTAVLVSTVTHAVLVQAMYLIDSFTLYSYQMLLLYLIMPACIVALSVGVSAYVVFPIPFSVLSMMPPFYLLLITSIRLVVGARVMEQMLANKAQVSRCAYFICAQTSTVAIFPAYEVLFRAAEGTSLQLPVILLLPVIKVAAKNVVLHFAKSLEDMIPVEVIFTVDFFNAVYVATCMQNASSAIAVSAITVTDLSQTITMLYGLQRRTTSILTRLQRHVDNAAENDNMLAMICTLCRNPASMKKQSCAGIRRRSCLPHQLSDMSKTLLDGLHGILNDHGADAVEPPASPGILTGPRYLSSFNPDNPPPPCCFHSRCTHTQAIHPTIPEPARPEHLQCVAKSQPATLERPTLLLESLETLFTTECLIVTAYLEAFMPLFYCSYMWTMVHLHNAQYHSEMKGVTRENVGATILPLFVFGLLQIASFVLLVALIKNNCGMRALYQLAFVLETQRSLIQCKMMLWMVITLCFRVVHFGVDFKFEFIRLGLPSRWTPTI